MNKIKLLLVEDETVLAEVIKETLETKGFEITLAPNGLKGWNAYKTFRPDICVVDIMMPLKDGLSLVADIRQTDELIPIILLTAKTQTADVIKGLETGANDYMKKPFSMEELILRINNLVRRRHLPAEEQAPANEVHTIGQYRFNTNRFELIRNDVVINLSQKEAHLLKMLIDSKSTLLQRRDALLAIWGDDTFFNARSMDVYITKLRKYFKHDPAIKIVNVRGKGYKLME